MRAVQGRPCTVELEGVRACDKTGRWNIGADGNWQDASVVFALCYIMAIALFKTLLCITAGLTFGIYCRFSPSHARVGSQAERCVLMFCATVYRGRL